MGAGGTASIRFEAGSTTHLRLLRRWLDLVLGEAATVDVQLVLSELATNAFQHGTDPVEIEVGIDHRDELRLRVTNRAEHAPMIRDQPVVGPRGRGLAIVAATASELTIEFEDGVATVACIFTGHGSRPR